MGWFRQPCFIVRGSCRAEKVAEAEEKCLTEGTQTDRRGRLASSILEQPFQPTTHGRKNARNREFKSVVEGRGCGTQGQDKRNAYYFELQNKG